MASIETPRAADLEAPVPWLSVATRTQVKEYAPTILTEFAVMASQIVVYKLAAHYLGRDGFSEYALARRTITVLVPIPVLGLAVGLPRYIGFSNGRGDSEGASRYFGATLLCGGGATLMAVLLINLFSTTFSFLFFGSRAYSYLAFPLSLVILGLCLHALVCGYFRGHLALNRANLLQFINMAVAPIIAFLAFPHSLVKVLSTIGMTSIFCSGVGLLLTPFRAVTTSSWKEVRELLGYGIQRVPGDFILMALFTLPATFVAHHSGVQEAGYVAFGVSVVSMIGAAFAPVGLVLLPKATLMLAGGRRDELCGHLRWLLRITLAASIVLVAAGWICMPSLIRVYLGASFEPVIPIARLLILGALPYSAYLVLRNIVDAYHEYGVTAAILASGLAVFVSISYFAGRAASGSSMTLYSFLLALILITMLARLECWRILHRCNKQ